MAQLIQSTIDVLNLANALSIAVQMHMMSQEQAAFVWKKHLHDSGILPDKEKVTEKKTVTK